MLSLVRVLNALFEVAQISRPGLRKRLTSRSSSKTSNVIFNFTTGIENNVCAWRCNCFRLGTGGTHLERGYGVIGHGKQVAIDLFSMSTNRCAPED